MDEGCSPRRSVRSGDDKKRVINGQKKEEKNKKKKEKKGKREAKERKG